jgi:membrane fusion protein, adhesin transport system
MITTAFARTFAGLLADRGRAASWIISGVILVFGAWCWWATHAQVTLYEFSPSARVELDAATYPIQSPLLGRVVQTELRVGQIVRSGDVLVEIDPVPYQLELRQEQISAQGLDPELARLRSQVSAEESARTEEQRGASLTAEEGGNRVREAEVAAEYAEAEAERMRRLRLEGIVSQRDLDKAEADSRRLWATVNTFETAVRLVPQEQVTRDRERDARLQGLYSRIATLEAERDTLKARGDRLAYEIDRRRVRAPIDGTVGESEILRIGAVVQEGEKLASIIPAGHLFVAAQFPPNAAFGRIRTGQSATLRLEGFPWAEFGSVSATVARVAQEVRDGNVRVELNIEAKSSFRGRLEHGMPGTLEVAVERLTPLSLALRASGRWLTAHQ